MRTGLQGGRGAAAGRQRRRAARSFPAELVVRAAGVKAPPFLKDLAGLETNRINQLVVLPTLQTTRDPNIISRSAIAPRARGTASRSQRSPRAQSGAPDGVRTCRAPDQESLCQQAARGVSVSRLSARLVSLGDYSTVGNLMGGGRNLWLEGHFAKMMYHVVLQDARARTCTAFSSTTLDTAARIISRPTETRSIALHLHLPRVAKAGPSMIRGSTVLYPLLGCPVTQVRAPSVYNPYFERAGIDAAVVVPIEVSEEAFPSFVQNGCFAPPSCRARSSPCVPHKRATVDVLDDCTATRGSGGRRVQRDRRGGRMGTPLRRSLLTAPASVRAACNAGDSEVSRADCSIVGSGRRRCRYHRGGARRRRGEVHLALRSVT